MNRRKPNILNIILCLPLFCALGSAANAQQLPLELKNFRQVQTAPVFTGDEGQWDTLIRERGWVMKEDGAYRMWYTGYNPAVEPVTMKLGYATSPDGLHWTRHSRNPIFVDVWVEDMMIVREDDTLYMFAEGANDQAQLLKSTDGLKWQHVGVLDVRLTNGDKIPAGPYGTPTAYLEDGTWYLFYERRDQGIWLATSKNMKTWTNVSDEPLILPGPDDYDKLMIAMNQVVKLHDRYYAVMHGTGTPTKPRDWCTYIATSKDLRTWQKCTSGPILPIKDNRSSGVLVLDGSDYRLFTMHADVHVYQR